MLNKEIGFLLRNIIIYYARLLFGGYNDGRVMFRRVFKMTATTSLI